MSAIVTYGCIPSLFGFKDFTNVSNDRYKEGYRLAANGRRFNTAVPHPDGETRFCLAVIGIGFLSIIPAIRLPLRALCLLSGDFAKRGYELAKKDWDLERQAWSLNPDRNDSAPGKASLYGKVIAYSLWQLVKNIMKIATYPIAMVAMAFATLYGCLIHHADGMLMCSAIEQAWSRDGVVITTEGGEALYRFTDCIAACMQPEDVWDEVNLYGIGPSVSAYLGDIKRLLKNNSRFFEAEGISVELPLKWVEKWRNTSERYDHGADFMKVFQLLQQLQVQRIDLIEEQRKGNAGAPGNAEQLIENTKQELGLKLAIAPKKNREAIATLKAMQTKLKDSEELFKQAGLNVNQVQVWIAAWLEKGVRGRIWQLQTFIDVNTTLNGLEAALQSGDEPSENQKYCLDAKAYIESNLRLPEAPHHVDDSIC